MAFNFPNAPVLDQEFVDPSGVTYVWNGYGWGVKAGGAAPPPTGDFVLKTGDEMSGGLVINTVNATLKLQKQAPGESCVVNGWTGSQPRWALVLGNNTLEAGANAGSDFAINRYDDAGTRIDAPFEIIRSTGVTKHSNSVIVDAVGRQTNVNPGNLHFNTTVAGDTVGIQSNINGVAAWGLHFSGPGDANFRLSAYDDAGVIRSEPLIIDRTNAHAAFSGMVSVNQSGEAWLAINGGTNAAIAGNLAATGGCFILHLARGPNGNCELHRITSSGTTHGVWTINRDTGDTQLHATLWLETGNTGHPLIVFNRTGMPQSYIEHNGMSFNFYSDSGKTTGMYMLPGASAWTALSDARFPHKAAATSVDNVLDRLAGVQLYSNVGPGGQNELFFKAQELAVSLPELVHAPDGPQSRDAGYVPTGLGDPNAWGVSYDRSGAVALQAIKELKAQIDELRAQLDAINRPTPTR